MNKIMDDQELLEEAKQIFEEENKLVQITGKSAVFVGDTHGDLQATRKVFDKYEDSHGHIVFLGDYVDRGPNSLENLWYLLSKKVKSPEKVYLLMGNHEGWKVAQFSPADFWTSIKPGMRKQYANLVAKLPLAVYSTMGIIATHGGLPDVENLSSINEIKLGSKEWRQLTWGDWSKAPGIMGGGFSGRPQLGRDYFFDIMERFDKNVLVRSHQPHADQYIFDNRCLTIFTSSAYGQVAGGRRVALASLESEVKSAHDLKVESI